MELETREKPDTRHSTVSTQQRPTQVRRPTTAAADRLRPAQNDLAFKNFGVMDTGAQDKKSTLTSILVNGSILALVIWASTFATKKLVQVSKLSTVSYREPPPPPKPPVELPPTPVIKVQPPKALVDPPKIEVPEPPKVPPPVFKAEPIPVKAPTPPAPKAVQAPPAPKPVAIQIAQAASVANHDQHPSPIRVGSLTNPINSTTGPAVSKVNLGNSGAPGMNAANTGHGPASAVNLGGSGSPNGTNMNGHANSAVAIKGLTNGVAGGTGPLTGSRPAGAVLIASNNPTPLAIHQNAPPASTAAAVAPKVLFKPRPDYTEDARNLHLEGKVYVKIHVSSGGAVQVIAVTNGLGHGLDQSAIRAVQAMRFQPAVQNGQPVDWDGVVTVNFQLAS